MEHTHVGDRETNALAPACSEKDVVVFRANLHVDDRVPVPEAVGCAILTAPGGWRGFLLTREVEDAVDLEAFLYGRARGLPAGYPFRPDLVMRLGKIIDGTVQCLNASSWAQTK